MDEGRRRGLAVTVRLSWFEELYFFNLKLDFKIQKSNFSKDAKI